MKIGINGRFLAYPYTGIGQYTSHLLMALGHLDAHNQYYVICPQKIPQKFPRNINIVVVKEKKYLPKGLAKSIFEQIQVPKAFNKLNVDLAHFLYPSIPRFFLSDIPIIVTVHDLIPWQWKEYAPSLLSRLYHLNAKSCLKRAHAILTVSHATKQKLRSSLNSRQPVYVCPNGVSSVYHHAPSKKEIEIVKKKYNLNRRFILYVGGYDIRKNVRALLTVYKKYIQNTYSYDLVLVGGKTNDSILYQDFDLALGKNEEKAHPNRGHLKKVGFIQEKDLNVLYHLCAVFVNLSLDEGFNIPLLEAASAAAPILASLIPVHQEILGDAALYTDPLNQYEIALNLKKMLSSRSLKTTLGKKAQKIAQTFSWEKSAQAHLKIYQKVVTNKACPNFTPSKSEIKKKMSILK